MQMAMIAVVVRDGDDAGDDAAAGVAADSGSEPGWALEGKFGGKNAEASRVRFGCASVRARALARRSVVR
jgi:hypothetical protein